MRAAASHYREMVARQDEVVARGEATGPALRAEFLLGAQTLSRAAKDTALFAYEHSGTSVVYASSPIQRCFRDLLTGLKHGTFSPSILGRIGKAGSVCPLFRSRFEVGIRVARPVLTFAAQRWPFIRTECERP